MSHVRRETGGEAARGAAARDGRPESAAGRGRRGDTGANRVEQEERGGATEAETRPRGGARPERGSGYSDSQETAGRRPGAGRAGRPAAESQTKVRSKHVVRYVTYGVVTTTIILRVDDRSTDCMTSWSVAPSLVD